MAESDNVIIISDHGIEYKLIDYLKQYDYNVMHVESKTVTINELIKFSPNVILLDWRTNKLNAQQTCVKLFQTGKIGIIVTTDKFNESDCIAALDAGADDYVIMPLNPRELHARMKAISRRLCQQPKLEKLRFEGWELDFNSRTLKNRELEEVSLSINEFELLATLVKNPQRILSRDELYNINSDSELAPFDRRIDIQISRLRQKIEQNPKKPELIKTVRCGGYLFTGKVVPAGS